jgi:hypothetical protein
MEIIMDKFYALILRNGKQHAAAISDGGDHIITTENLTKEQAAAIEELITKFEKIVEGW